MKHEFCKPWEPMTENDCQSHETAWSIIQQIPWIHWMVRGA